MNRRSEHILSLLLLLATVSGLLSCSGEGPTVIDPSADERNETALIGTRGADGGELARYYEVSGLVDADEYRSVNGAPLGLPVSAIYEAYEKVWIHSNPTGELVVLDLSDRKELARISGFPATDTAQLSGMAFSNLSQAWVMAYGSPQLYHIDAYNYKLVGAIPLPGNPTAIATVDNRVFIGMEMPDGTGAIGLMRSNDPDFVVDIIQPLRRPPVYMTVTPERDFVAIIVPGEKDDLPETAEFDTDPALFILALQDYSIQFEGRFISPSLREYVGVHPTFASSSNDFFIYLATSEGIKRIDTKSWGQVIDLVPAKPYRIVNVDYWTDLLYAVSPQSPTMIERIDKQENILEPITVQNPITAIRFVSTSKVLQ